MVVLEDINGSLLQRMLSYTRMSDASLTQEDPPDNRVIAILYLCHQIGISVSPQASWLDLEADDPESFIPSYKV